VRQDHPKIPESVVTLPTTFEVGTHRVVVSKEMEGRWRTAVDDRPLASSFHTQADAWEAGVREAYRLDGPSR
jgi:hypothetical protein